MKGCIKGNRMLSQNNRQRYLQSLGQWMEHLSRKSLPASNILRLVKDRNRWRSMIGNTIFFYTELLKQMFLRGFFLQKWKNNVAISEYLINLVLNEKVLACGNGNHG